MQATQRLLRDNCPSPVDDGWINGIDGATNFTLGFGTGAAYPGSIALPEDDCDYDGQTERADRPVEAVVQTRTESADLLGDDPVPITLVRMRDAFVRIDDGAAGFEVGGTIGGNGSVWTAVFTPPADGSLDGIRRLLVSGQDRERHFLEGPNADGQIVARNHRGDELDSDPQDLAKAAADEPHDWACYTPGVDRNHIVKIDVTPPSMALRSAGVDSRGNTVAIYSIRDATSGMKAIAPRDVFNATVEVASFAHGDSPVDVTLTVIDRTQSARVTLDTIDVAGNPREFRVVIPVLAIKRGPQVPPINPESRGRTPVAVFTDAGFNVTSLPVETLKFGPGEAPSACRGHIHELDGDHDRDLMVHFSTEAAAIQPGDRSACLVGSTDDGAFVVTCQSIRTVPSLDRDEVLWPDEGALEELPWVTSDASSPAAEAELVADVEILPRTNQLLRVRPNPTRNLTGLTYGLAKAARVDLSIYDVRGRLMARVLENETVSPGPHDVSWSGIGLDGHPVVAGVYFARLLVDRDATGTVKKFVVVR